MLTSVPLTTQVHLGMPGLPAPPLRKHLAHAGSHHCAVERSQKPLRGSVFHLYMGTILQRAVLGRRDGTQRDGTRSEVAPKQVSLPSPWPFSALLSETLHAGVLPFLGGQTGRRNEHCKATRVSTGTVWVQGRLLVSAGQPARPVGTVFRLAGFTSRPAPQPTLTSASRPQGNKGSPQQLPCVLTPALLPTSEATPSRRLGLEPQFPFL